MPHKILSLIQSYVTRSLSTANPEIDDNTANNRGCNKIPDALINMYETKSLQVCQCILKSNIRNCYLTFMFHIQTIIEANYSPIIYSTNINNNSIYFLLFDT